MESRAVVDQAKGILMHALGCSASDALERMRRVSQTQHVKVTDVARQVEELPAVRFDEVQALREYDRRRLFLN